MNWTINFLIKLLGGFLTAFSLVGLTKLITNPTASNPIAWIVIFLTAGLALLFAPEIKMK